MQLYGAVRRKGAPLGELAMPQGIDGGGQILDKGENHEKNKATHRNPNPVNRRNILYQLCQSPSRNRTGRLKRNIPRYLTGIQEK